MIFHLLAQTVSKPSDELEDIKPIVASGPTYWIVIMIAILLLLAIAAYFLWPNSRPKPVQPPPPRELAKRQLEAVELRINTDSGYNFSIEVSDILRGFIEQQFGIHASRQTTTEFLREMTKTSQIKSSHQEQLRNFLDMCDLIKFARTEVDSQVSSRLFDQARIFVEEVQ